MLSAEIIRELRETMQKLTQTCSSVVCTFDTHLFSVSLLYIISRTIEYLDQLCFLYAKLYSHLLSA